MSITYRLSFWDAPARPLFRFGRCGVRLAEAIGPAPLEAAAIWTGRIPAGTSRIEVSPTNRVGLFDFRIESLCQRSWPLLVLEGFRRVKGPAGSAVLARMIGWRPEADNNLAWAIGAYPLGDYDSWTQSRRRSLELAGIDRPRVFASETEPFHIVLPPQPAASLERSLSSLRSQRLDRWRALVVGSLPASAMRDSRVTRVGTAEAAVEHLIADKLWFTVLPEGATLENTALPSIAERRAREPEARLVYGDELVGGQPSLKPGWSPRLANALPYLGRAVFGSATVFTPADLASLVEGGEWIVPAGIVPVPVRRILLRRPEAIVPPTRDLLSDASINSRRPLPLAGRGEGGGRAVLLGAETGGTTPIPNPYPQRGRELPNRAATRTVIVVPTRDQPALLTRLVASIRAHSAPGSYQLVIVDNGDADGPAASLLAELDATPDAIVLSRPGPFNFSALCNEAVRATPEPILLFLNDDMEVLSDNWLERLGAQASAPDAGAVGAKLTYPDGRLQHVGVLAGMGGSAGHFGTPAPGDDPGWAGRNLVPHEVSAVTGACLAVSREKFDAVGGFDEVHLPVELSDIDLCFKLNARGWQSMVDPAVHLLHEESFSRGGATFRRLSKYHDQRAIFIERWRNVLRDDPVFHPALSLYSWRAALG